MFWTVLWRGSLPSGWIYTYKHVTKMLYAENVRFAVKALCTHIDATGWCVLSSAGIFYPVFIYGTITSDIFLSLLKDEFVPSLQGYGNAINAAWIQHDSTSAKPYLSFSIWFSGEVERNLSKRHTALFKEGLSWPRANICYVFVTSSE
jgi:hypothetical protein